MQFISDSAAQWLPLLAAFIGYCLAFLRPRREVSMRWLLLLIIVPTAAYLVAGLFVSRLGHARNFTYLLPVFFIGIAYLLNELPRALKMIILVAVVYVQIRGSQDMLAPLTRRLIMRDAVKGIKNDPSLCIAIGAVQNDARSFRAALRTSTFRPYSGEAFDANTTQPDSLLTWYKKVSDLCPAGFAFYDFEGAFERRGFIPVPCAKEETLLVHGALPGVYSFLDANPKTSAEFVRYRCRPFT